MKMKQTLSEEVFKNRRDKIFAMMEERSVLLLFSGEAPRRSGDQDYAYTVDRNYYYLTGKDVHSTIYMASKGADGKVDEKYFVPRPDPRTETFMGHMFTAEEASEYYGAPAAYADTFEAVFDGALSSVHTGRLYADLMYCGLRAADAGWGARTADRIRAAFPYLQITDVGAVIGDMRRFKEPCELDMLREAIRITGLGIGSILERLAPGVNERELQARFDYTITVNGASDDAFAPIVAGGMNSTCLHYGVNDQDLQDGDVLLVDLGAEYGYYNGDISRTFPVNGKFTEEQRYYYDAVLDAQREVIKRLKPGMHLTDTTKIAREKLFEYCQKSGIAEKPEDMETLLPHGVSHYLGLDTHDSGERAVLEPGMVITVEPGIYIKDLRLGIRIEDDVVITEDGCEVLSPQIMKDADEIEAFMAARPAVK